MDRPAKVALIDIESTGLNHLSRPWEIAVIVREYTEGSPHPISEQEHVWHVRYDYNTLPEGTETQALIVGKWAQRGPEEHSARYLERLREQGVRCGAGGEFAIAAHVHRVLSTATIAGIGVHYDAEVLGRMFLRHGLPWHPWHYGIIDLKTAAWGHLRGRRGRVARTDATVSEVQARLELISEYDQLPVKSERIAEWLGVKPPVDEERHTAIGDARWAARWWDAL